MDSRVIITKRAKRSMLRQTIRREGYEKERERLMFIKNRANWGWTDESMGLSLFHHQSCVAVYIRRFDECQGKAVDWSVKRSDKPRHQRNFACLYGGGLGCTTLLLRPIPVCACLFFSSFGCWVFSFEAFFSYKEISAWLISFSSPFFLFSSVVVFNTSCHMHITAVVFV